MLRWSPKHHIHSQSRFYPSQLTGLQCRPSPLSARQYTTAVPASSLQFGQPLHETHPHLLKPGELTPGITALEYYQRRHALASKLPEGGIAILAAAEVKYKTRHVFYPFHQDEDFFYLTGFLEPDAVAVIAKTSSSPLQSGSESSEEESNHEFHLFVREKDPKAEQWEGLRSGTIAARDVFNADYSGDIQSCTSRLRDLIGSASKIYTDIPTSPSTASPSFLSRLTSSRSSNSASSPTSIPSLISNHASKPLQLHPLTHSLRLYKSPAELSLLRQIGRSSGRAFTSLLRTHVGPSLASPADPSLSETTLSSALSHALSTHALPSQAYIPVIAGGARGSIIHYTANNALLQPNSTVLIDAGGELGGYVTDITRVYPIGGRYSDAQRELYEAVLDVQRKCVALCRSDGAGSGKSKGKVLSLDDLHNHAENLLHANLTDLGFNLRSPQALQTLFPHHLSHYLGLSIHDTGSISRKRALEEGMVVTVEPGVYVPEEEGWWPDRYRGLNVRIEDTVAVGGEGEGPVGMSAEAGKEVVDIEEVARG